MRFIYATLTSMLLVSNLSAVELQVVNQFGETFVMTLEDSEGPEEIQENISNVFGVDPDNQRLLFVESGERGRQEDFVIRVQSKEVLPASPTSTPRDFDAQVTTEEATDIRYIVTTLANKPTAKLLFYKSSLDAAGDRVNHVHPLKFLSTIFKDEEMKVGAHNIAKKGWVWKEFIKGLGDSLSEEKGRDNLNAAQLAAFALDVDISLEIIAPSIQASKWEQFVQLLIKHIPRKGDKDKYNM